MKKKVISKAVKRVKSRSKTFGISLSLGQLKQLAEIYKLSEYKDHAPDGFMFMTSKSVNCQGATTETIEIVPYSNNFHRHDPKSPGIKFYEKDGVVGQLRIKLKPASRGAADGYGVAMMLDNQQDPCNPLPPDPGGGPVQCCDTHTKIPPIADLLREF